MNKSFLRSRSSSVIALALALAAVVSSCATTPPVAERFDVAGWATSGQVVQLRLDAAAVAMLRDFVGPSEANTMQAWSELLGRVDTLWMGLPDPVVLGTDQGLAHLRVGVEGRFPVAETSWALFWNRPPAPWTVSQPGDGTLLITRGTPGSTPLVPSSDSSEWGHDDVRLTWDRPGPSLLGPLASRLVELRRLVLELQTTGTGLSGRLRLELPDERAASAALVLFRLFGSSFEERWNQQLEWRSEGNAVVGEPVVISRQALVNLLINLTLTEKP